MKLSENEVRDITALLEAGKPLPDKYRFVLFGDDRELELIWDGKTHEITNVVMPFQTIEHVDEPRPEDVRNQQIDIFDVSSGRQSKGWTNKLIWGDNKFILSSLKGGPLREEIGEHGGIKLIYIDPPFDVGADFTMNIDIGDDSFTKHANVLEELAYRDTWGKGIDSFNAMIYERLQLMRDLLSDDGSIYVHCDWRVSSYLRLILDELFGKDNFMNEIVWQRTHQHGGAKRYGHIHDVILYYSKSDKYIFNQQFKPLDDSYVKSHYGQKDDDGRKYRLVTLSGAGPGPSRMFDDKLIHPPKGRHWAWSQENIDLGLKSGKIAYAKTGQPNIKQYLDEVKGSKIQTIWDDIFPVNPISKELIGYPTQKPEKLLERIISASSNSGDLIADFFVGSGTTASVAEKLGRKWIVSDLGKFSIHTTRKRIIDVQRNLKEEGHEYRAFEVLNLGRYERQYFATGYLELDETNITKVAINKEKEFNKLILQAYQGEAVDGYKTLKGKKANRYISVGPVNLPASRYYAEEVINECVEKGITKVDLLAFEFEMGLFPSIQDDASERGVDLVLKNIPIEVFDKRAVDAGEAKFYDVAYIEIDIHHKKNSIAVELLDYSVFYTQGLATTAEQYLNNNKSEIVVDNGEVIKVAKNKSGNILPREQLTKHWSDWVDYWAVDFDFESKKEIIRIKNKETGEREDKWSGDYIFENEWQSFRTKQERSLELSSILWECDIGRRKIAVKVIDIFGNDTMKVMEINVGKAF